MNSGSLSRERDPLERILEALEALDARVDAVPGAGLSLDPREPGRRATRMQALLLSAGDAPPDERVVLGEALAQVAESVLQAFPLNLFWDMDGVFAELRRVSCVSLADAGRLATGLADLMTLFGRESPIRFQYVHDFVYGFDWAEWVRREPAGRAAVGPFSARYVARTRQRGLELLALIEADDTKYPKVPAGEFRNPFTFTRTPEEERTLFESLAAADAIPNPAWCQHTAPRWERDFDAEREVVAARLGLLR
ncbi:MAG: hypothetical protein IPG81_13105 [Sandaracinaceae bacterium]|nr:hypothetical protein [Sandaracinaceae bacterium]MBP7682305.1 hypothetical protein [Deltaproteobacteria bacterium]